MKFVKLLVLFVFIGSIMVSCKETKKEEIKENIDAVDEQYKPADPVEPAESTQSETTESSASKSPASSEKSTPATKKTVTPVEVEEVTEADIKKMEAEDDEIEVIPETIADTPVIYPGCEGGSASEIRSCNRSKFLAFFGENFRSEVVDELDGLKAGTHSMRGLLKIDESGNIIVKRVAAEEKELKEEFKRVVSLYPVLTPATKNGKTVAVKFVLPIKFNVLN